jgi:hypothetical protein
MVTFLQKLAAVSAKHANLLAIILFKNPEIGHTGFGVIDRFAPYRAEKANSGKTKYFFIFLIQSSAINKCDGKRSVAFGRIGVARFSFL